MSRYAKSSGATTLEPFAPETPLRRFKPDFYNPPKELPSRNPKFGGGSVVRRFGRRLPKIPTPSSLPGAAAGFASGLFFAGTIAGLLPYVNRQGGYWKAPAGWVECRYPCWKPPANFWTYQHYRANYQYWCSPTDYCIGGQGINGAVKTIGNDIGLDSWATQFSVWYTYYLTDPGGVWRQQHHRSWSRPSGASGVFDYARWRTYQYVPGENPNSMTNSPSPSPDPAGDYHGPPDYPPVQTRAPSRPRNPPKRTRERKAKTKISTVLAIADFISESSELVGAFYDALPKKTKDKWGCDKLKRGLLDNAGQYGIDGVDCKLQALWHNWHKVDIQQGIKNAIANEIQDRILGGIQRGVPVNTGRTTDDAMKEINEWITSFNEWLGL